MERRRPRVRRAIFSRTELEPISTAAKVGMRQGQQFTCQMSRGHPLECRVGREARCAPRETARGLQAAEVEGRLFELATRVGIWAAAVGLAGPPARRISESTATA